MHITCRTQVQRMYIYIHCMTLYIPCMYIILHVYTCMYMVVHTKSDSPAVLCWLGLMESVVVKLYRRVCTMSIHIFTFMNVYAPSKYIHLYIFMHKSIHIHELLFEYISLYMVLTRLYHVQTGMYRSHYPPVQVARIPDEAVTTHRTNLNSSSWAGAGNW